MQAPREGLNPLRPYYVPPSIGLATDSAANATAGAARASENASSFSFPDLDYADYLPDAAPSITGSVRKFLDQALWKYTNVVMAQPFEVAKMILQVHVAQDEELDSALERRADLGSRSSLQDDYDEEAADYSDDEPNYFTSTTPFEPFSSSRSPARGRRGRPQRQEAPFEKVQGSPNQLSLKNTHSLLDALSSLSAASGPLALWRATNSTFVYGILSRTFEAFFRSFLAALFGLAEADVLIPVATGAIPDASILSSASPGTTLVIATAAAAMSAVLLAPIDAARTRLILTPSSHEPRTLLGTLRTLNPSYLIPAHLLPITLLTSTIPTLISSSTPLFLRTYLKIDPLLNPSSWSVATFLGSALDLSVKFPLETVLRRAQIATWTSPPRSLPTSSSKRKAIETVVPVPQAYRGVLPTVWGIMREEGFSESQKDRIAAAAGRAPRRKRKGQGVEGLYRGWRVGLWGLVGVWGAGFVGGLQTGVEMPTDSPGVHGGKF